MKNMIKNTAILICVVIAIAGLAIAMVSAYRIVAMQLDLDSLGALAIGTALCLMSIMLFGIVKDSLRKNA